MNEFSVISAIVEILATVITVTWFVSGQINKVIAISLENRRLVERVVAEQKDAMMKELNRIQLRLQRLEINLGLNGKPEA